MQYCDGLRGPMVIYDPNDPHQSLYDVDDGAFVSCFMDQLILINIANTEETVITLADWCVLIS
jgi:hypothetical protein